MSKILAIVFLFSCIPVFMVREDAQYSILVGNWPYVGLLVAALLFLKLRRENSKVHFEDLDSFQHAVRAKNYHEYFCAVSILSLLVLLTRLCLYKA